MTLHTTNYIDTFIEVADDCPTDVAQEPPASDSPTIAALHYRLIAERPFGRTSDDVIFETQAIRRGIPDGERDAARAELFSKGQACLRSSPLGKRYGWGILNDREGRVRLVARESDEYARLAADPALRHVKAMRAKRA